MVQVSLVHKSIRLKIGLKLDTVWKETLADLAKDHKFAKVYFANYVFVANLSKFAPTKVSLTNASRCVFIT